jgi:hypothetical protein
MTLAGIRRGARREVHELIIRLPVLMRAVLQQLSLRRESHELSRVLEQELRVRLQARTLSHRTHVASFVQQVVATLHVMRKATL